MKFKKISTIILINIIPFMKKLKMEIIIKYKNGETIRKISENMNVNKNTVNKWVKRFRENNSLLRKSGTGLHKRIEINTL